MTPKNSQPLPPNKYSLNRTSTSPLRPTHNENNPHIINRNHTPTHKRTLSPSNPTPTLKKIELKPTKHNKRIDRNGRRSEGNPHKTRLRSLFRQLTRNNPPGVDKLSAEYMNLSGIEHSVLDHLQCFFEQLDENEFYSLS